ncbi:hypothetical protein H0O00_02710 [Candidatus Micrarchaeota archaeon]|nr:hypothetical protein [Candidatus Micrarchaeota archaeon]
MELRFDEKERNARRNADCENDGGKKGFWGRFKECQMKFTQLAVLSAVLTAGPGCYKVIYPQELGNDAASPSETTQPPYKNKTPANAFDRDSGTDTAPDTDADTHTYADAGVGGDVDANTDAGADAGNVVVIEGGHLIGDYLNRQIGDRQPNVTGDPDAEYAMGGSDTAENANPFTDGAGGNLGPTETFMYQIGANEFPVLDDQQLVDADSGDVYVEKQAIWISGSTEFDSDVDDIIGNLHFIAYTQKFDGPASDETGIPVCTAANGLDYSACKTDAPGDTTIEDATERHRVKVWFLGEQWILSEMNAPVAGLTDQNTLVNGGSIKLAQEAVSGILNVGESLPIDDLRFQLDDLETHDSTASAILSVIDANGNILKKDKVDPGQTKEFNIGGKVYRFHVYKTALGSAAGTKWADVAIFANEIELIDSQRLDPNNGTNPGYDVALGWKNRAGSVASTKPDSLRTIIIYAEDIEDVSSSGSETLEAGDYVTIAQNPAPWNLIYGGLDITSDDMKSLELEIKSTVLQISASTGPYMGDGTVACAIRAPYLKVTSEESGNVFTVKDDTGAVDMLSDNHFIVVLNASSACGSVTLTQGTLLMHLSPSTNQYGLSEYPTGGRTVKYDAIGGGILVETRQDVEAPKQGQNDIGNLLKSTGEGNNVCGSSTCADVYVGVAEHAGADATNCWIMGITNIDSSGDATFDFDSNDVNGNPLTSGNGEVLYKPAGPVIPGIGMVEEGYVSERGSTLETVSSKSVTFNFAHKLVKAVWSLVSNE